LLTFALLGASTTVLNLTGAPSSPGVPVCQPFTAASDVNPQPVSGQAPSSAALPVAASNFTQQPQPVMSFQPRLPSQTDTRPAFGQAAQPSLQPVFGGGQAFGVPKPKDATDLPKFTAIPSSKPVFPNLSTSPELQSAEGFGGKQTSAMTAVGTRMSSLASQSFNFGSPMGQSTPAPAANKVASQLRFDTPAPAAAAPTSAPTAVKAVATTTTEASVAAPKPFCPTVAPVRPTGDLSFPTDCSLLSANFYAVSMTSLCLSVSLSVTLVDCGHIVQQKVEMGIDGIDRCFGYLYAEADSDCDMMLS